MSAAAGPITDTAPASKRKGKKKTKDGPSKTDDGEHVSSDNDDDDDDDAHAEGSIEPGSPAQAITEPDDAVNGTQIEEKPSLNNSNGHAEEEGEEQQEESKSTSNHKADDAVRKLDAMTKDREALMTDVQEMRKQLESIKESHAEEVKTLQAEIDESNAARETAEEQYQNLMGRVEKIKETLSDRLKRDKQELEETKERVEELEAENEDLRRTSGSTADEVARMRDELHDATRELTTLRSRSNLSAQNWLKEKEDLTSMVHRLKKEVETTSNAMGEWEVIAMEERSVKDGLVDKVAELQEELAATRSGYDTTARERDSLSSAVDNLQRSLQEIQEARKRELREMVEAAQDEGKLLKDLVRQADARAVAAEAAKETLTKELDRTAPFEEAVKEKNLLIGKLRHEAIVLNEHLTKALRYLKKTKPEDNVDRQIVTNHLLHFLNLDRADPKRFQILQVMAGYLNWTDEQREQAGLARPGASNSSLRLPISPFHRTPSTPSLNADFLADMSSSSATTSAAHRESLADLWAGFLERSASEQADGTTAPSSRKDSMSSAATRPDTRGAAGS